MVSPGNGKCLSGNGMGRMTVNELCGQYLTPEEADQIHQQFQSDSFLFSRQVMWSGMLQETAQKWADEHGMQTLTTALGPLKMPGHPSYTKLGKTDKQWSKYMKGASALFAYHAAKGEVVTVLCPPPPERFHPSGWTNYQWIEEPILKGAYGNDPIGRIDLVHPSVAPARDFRYQIWPVDETHDWIQKFGSIAIPQLKWRNVKSPQTISPLPIRVVEKQDARLRCEYLAESESKTTLRICLRSEPGWAETTTKAKNAPKLTKTTKVQKESMTANPTKSKKVTKIKNSAKGKISAGKPSVGEKVTSQQATSKKLTSKKTSSKKAKSKMSTSASSQTRKKQCPTKTNTEAAGLTKTAKRQLNQSLKASQNLYLIVALESMARCL